MSEGKRGLDALFTKDRPTPEAHRVNVDHVRKALGEEGLTRAEITKIAREQIEALVKAEVAKVIPTPEKIGAMVNAAIDRELSRYASSPQTLKNIIADQVANKVRGAIMEKLTLTVTASAKL
jgi:hypothetical protein